jgi:hypothetical protein
MDLAGLVGLVVEIDLGDHVLVGAIAEIDPTTHKLSLVNVLEYDQWSYSKHVFGSQLVGLKVLENGYPVEIPQFLKQPAKNQQTILSNQNTYNQRSSTQNNKQSQSKSPKKPKKIDKKDTFEIDVQDESFTEDFDFEHSLGKFDKKAGNS